MPQIRIYATKDDREPYSLWFRKLRDKRAQAKILQRITRLAKGNPGDCKNLGGGLDELRIDHGPGYRVYLSRQGDITVLLLTGGDKRKQQMDIEKAREYLADWEARGKP